MRKYCCSRLYHTYFFFISYIVFTTTYGARKFQGNKNKNKLKKRILLSALYTAAIKGDHNNRLLRQEWRGRNNTDIYYQD